MHHGHRAAGRSSDEVELGVHRAQRPLQHHHGKHAGAGADVAGARGHAVGGGHTGAGVPLRRAERDARLQGAGRVQQASALRGKVTSQRTGGQHAGQDGPQVQIYAMGLQQGLRFLQAADVIVAGFGVNGEHPTGLAHTQHLLAGQLPVKVPCQRGQKDDAVHMVLAVEHRLIQVGDAPTLGDVILQKFGQPVGGRAGDSVAPGAEGGQLTAPGVKGQVAVHHAGDAHRPHSGKRHAVAGLHVGGQGGKGRLHPRPNVLQTVSPNAVFQPVFPGMIPAGDGRVIRANQHRLDAGGTQFDAQGGLPTSDGLLDLLHSLLPSPQAQGFSVG